MIVIIHLGIHANSMPDEAWYWPNTSNAVGDFA